MQKIEFFNTFMEKNDYNKLFFVSILQSLSTFMVMYFVPLLFILTIKSIQFNSIGIENTVDINRPLLSKYCCLENECQFMAAYSFMDSEKYTADTKKGGKRIQIINLFTNIWNF